MLPIRRDQCANFGMGVAGPGGDGRPHSIPIRCYRSGPVVPVTRAGIDSKTSGLEASPATQEVAPFPRIPVLVSAFRRMFARVLFCVQSSERRTTKPCVRDFRPLVFANAIIP